MAENRSVLVVGQCSYDYSALARLLQSCALVPVEASTLAEARRLLRSESFGLVLVNRVICGDEEAGLGLIAELRKGEAAPPAMLISDLRDAQEQAVSRGALAGFGKSELRDPAVKEKLASVLGGR